MPIIRQMFSEEITDSSTKKTIVVPRTTGNYPQTSVNSTQSYQCVSEISDKYFANLKSCLEQTGLEITFDESEYSFTVFGMKFYSFCMNVNTSGNINYYSITPVLLRYGANLGVSDYSSIASDSKAYLGRDRQATILEYKTTNCEYQINIYYNDDYLYMTYGSKLNLTEDFPIGCIIKCKSVDDKDCIYTSLCPNYYSTGHSTTTKTCYHIITMVDKPYVNYPNTTNNNCLNEYMFTKVNHQSFLEMSDFFDTSKILKMRPICMQGVIEFSDNFIGAPFDLSPGYYEIDGETYYCPGGILYNTTVNATPNYLSNINKILLKL